MICGNHSEKYIGPVFGMLSNHLDYFNTVKKGEASWSNT